MIKSNVFHPLKLTITNFVLSELLETNGMVLWRDLPFLLPFIRPTTNGHHKFVQLGLVYTLGQKKQAPPEMYAQFTNDLNTFFYAWEYTPAVLFQARNISQLFRLIAQVEQIPQNSLWWKWIDKAIPLLDETVTIGKYKDARTIAFVRRSQGLLAGWEIVTLANIMEGAKPVPPLQQRLHKQKNNATNKVESH